MYDNFLACELCLGPSPKFCRNMIRNRTKLFDRTIIIFNFTISKTGCLSLDVIFVKVYLKIIQVRHKI